MSYKKIKASLTRAITHVSDHIEDFAVNPGHDFTRSGKLPPNYLLNFLINEGSGTSKNELMDFFKFQPDTPTASAFIQQRAKIKETAFEYIFNATLPEIPKNKDLLMLAADGSTFSFSSLASYTPPEYFMNEGHSKKGFYSIHVNALYDINHRVYRAVLMQPLHCKDEYGAFCSMVDNFPATDPYTVLFTGDRGYPSYNTMAHCIMKKQYFLFRVKDITGKGISHDFQYPNSDTFDITVDVSIVRSHDKKVNPRCPNVRFIGKNNTFDYLPYGSMESFDMSFRIVRFKLSDGSYECLFTNLPADKYNTEMLKLLYFKRWKIEDSFRKLKYTIGAVSFHSMKVEFIRQELWARLIGYNLTEMAIADTLVDKRKDGKDKYDYAVNFAKAAHICRNYFCLHPSVTPANMMLLLQKELVPIRNDRQFERLQTAHFRKPKYFMYRAS